MSDEYKTGNGNKPLKFSKGGESVKNPAMVEVEFHPLEVKVYDDNFDRALRAFRAIVQKEKILSLYKEKQTYEKPSVKRRRKRNEAIRKNIDSDRKDRRE